MIRDKDKKDPEKNPGPSPEPKPRPKWSLWTAIAAAAMAEIVPDKKTETASVQHSAVQPSKPSQSSVRPATGSWRMPTKAEWVELKNNCTCTWTSQGGHNGYRVTGKNGSSIFLPAAGWRDGVGLGLAGECGFYWLSSLDSDDSCYSYCCCFGSSYFYPSARSYRYCGRSVRPVSSSL